MQRRDALTTLAALVAAACAGNGRDSGFDPSAGRLRRHPAGAGSALPAGTHRLHLGRGRDGVLYVPAHEPDTALPLVLLLHGAGGSGARIAERFAMHAEAHHLLLLAPDSRGHTWDAAGGREFGEDVAFIDSALRWAHERCRIDAARTCAAGFSDGATYAISLAYLNGDLFTLGAGFAPGALLGRRPHGASRFYISHGTADPVLDIDRASRRVVPYLESHGYDVRYREHPGGHVLVPEHVAEAFRWFLSA